MTHLRLFVVKASNGGLLELQVQQAAERFDGISHGHWDFACLSGA